MGDGLQGEVEGVCHAHRPQGGLLQKSHCLNVVQDFRGGGFITGGFFPIVMTPNGQRRSHRLQPVQP